MSNLPAGAEFDRDAPWESNYSCYNCSEELGEYEYVCPSCGYDTENGCFSEYDGNDKGLLPKYSA